MNKQKYVIPRIEIVKMESEMLMAASADKTIGYTDREANNNYDALSNERRGSWGNLWE